MNRICNRSEANFRVTTTVLRIAEYPAMLSNQTFRTLFFSIGIPKKVSFLLLFGLTSCGIFRSNIPQPRNEFRGFWIATVVNIDWPTNGSDPVKKQKADYLKILDFYKDLNFNAAIVQIRAAGDAFYGSEYAPWSRFLTGEEGKAPDTKIDLLKWMIDQTHQRGMEFHAWMNPYRATFDLKTGVLSPTNNLNLHPEWILKYGKKYYYDPGLPQVRQRLTAILGEVVSHYDIDAIHFDDYFYPYKIKDEVFHDSLTYSSYGLPNQSLEDWRRSNIDSLIKNIHKTIKAKKPWVQFGVSPFGVWKNRSTDPKGSDTKAGQTTYEDLYADPLLWMEKGWIDYLAPQVYWSMDLPVASHRKIVDWWADQSKNTNLYIGNAAYKVRNNSDKAWDNKKELPNQIKLARNTDGVQGNVFFSAKSLMKNDQDIVTYLKKKFYKHLALPPTTTLVSSDENIEIKFESANVTGDSVMIKFNNLSQKRYALVYSSGKKTKSFYPLKKVLAKIAVKKSNCIRLNKKQLKGKNRFALTFIDKFRQESDPIIIHLNQTN